MDDLSDDRAFTMELLTEPKLALKNVAWPERMLVSAGVSCRPSSRTQPGTRCSTCTNGTVYPSSLQGPSLDQQGQVVERRLLPEHSVGDWQLLVNMDACGSEALPRCRSTRLSLPPTGWT